LLSRARSFPLAALAAMLAASAACTPLAVPASPPAIEASPGPAANTQAPPTLVASPGVSDPTPTDCPTAWSWAYGPGSAEFDAALMHSLRDEGLTVRTVTSSTFGENNLCNGVFHAAALDVVVELEIADSTEEGRFSDLNATVNRRIEAALPISNIPNVGRVEVHLLAPEGAWRCVTASGSTECGALP